MSLHPGIGQNRYRKERKHERRVSIPERCHQPRVRPFGTIHIFDGKLYIQTGKKKNVSKQLGINGKTELCAMKGDKWIRVSGTLVNDDRREAKVSMLDAYPSLKKMYSPDDGNTQVLYFRDAIATIYSFSGEPVVIRF